jgi:hypothetical protein
MMVVRLIQNLPNFRQRKSQLPGLPGKSKPPKILGIVLLVVVVRVTGWFEQFFTGVETNRIRINTSGLCNLFDFHLPQLPNRRLSGNIAKVGGEFVRGGLPKML